MFQDRKTQIKDNFELVGIECGSGWYGLIMPIIIELNKFNKEQKTNAWEDLKPSQIKEKWGGLRFYCSPSEHIPEHIYKMIKKAEELSYHICEKCGSPKDVGRTTSGWITTLCKIRNTFCYKDTAKMKIKHTIISH